MRLLSTVYTIVMLTAGRVGSICMSEGEHEMMWYTALTGAAEKGQTHALHMLLQHGVDPNLNLDPYIGNTSNVCV